MLSVGKIAAGPGAGRYYIDQVAQGREDYYAGEGEAAGAWCGAGAAALGLVGEVPDQGLTRLLEGRDPGSAALLGSARPTGSVAGFDLTFRAPKSVSVFYAVAEPAVVAEITRAHEAAMAQALAYLERDACFVRRGHAGSTRVRAEGFVAAAFRHRASRAGDPLLHTHVVVANAAQGPDGRWTALDGRELYRHAKVAGYLYQAALRAELSNSLGVEWQAATHGAADIKGVSRAVIEHFSQRRAEILEHMEARGERSARAAQVATLETRRQKEYGVPVARLRAEWRARAAEHGLDSAAVTSLLQRRPERRIEQSNDLAERLEGPDGLTRDRSTFTRRDVLQAFAEHARDGATVASVESRVNAFLVRPEIVELDPVAGERRYSTRELLEIEVAALRSAERRKDEDTAVADDRALDDALARRPSMGAEQRELVTALARSGRGVEVVRAPAGAGKTFALDAAREAWQASGVGVIGCALSARAARELRDQAAIDATTIARLTYALDGGAGLAPGSVLVVDEAGMVGTRDLARLIDAVDAASAKLVLVGDNRQLPEIQAGGLFAALADRLGARELHEVRRQRAAWDREALGALRAGDVDAFAAAYHEHGRIVEASTAETARERLVTDWLQAHERGERAVMLAHRRRDVADLNERARRGLRADGRIGDDQLRTDARTFAIGDRVVARRNDRRLGVVNGDTGQITTIAGGRVLVELDNGREVALTELYVRAGHLEHGYALTAHLAQGATVDRAFVLGSDELYREWGYTALTRHRLEARFYVSVTPAFLNQSDASLVPQRDVTRSVASMLAASRSQRLAVESARSNPMREAIADALNDARRELAAFEETMTSLREQRQELRWHQRSAIRALERRIEDWMLPCELRRAETERLARELDAYPEPSVVSRAVDPLPDVELRGRDLGRDRSRDWGLER